MKLSALIKEYMLNSSLHGAKFVADDKYHITERIFWLICVTISWIASGMLIVASLEAFRNNAISFVVETSYNDWETHFPSIVICEAKNMDRIQLVAEELWGENHDFTMEEVLSEIAFFRGDSYHTMNECGENEANENCIYNNFSYYSLVVRNDCHNLIDSCIWNNKIFNCCEYFHPMDTELGLCYGLNSMQINNPKGKKLNMISSKYTGPGKLNMEVLTESFIFTLGEEDVPNIVTAKSEVLHVGPYIKYIRKLSIKNIENDPGTSDVSVEQRSCRYYDENILNVHRYYSYSACSVQCRKDEQLKYCNCTSHLMPNTAQNMHCNMTGLKCLNEHYEDLSVVIAKWSYGRRGVVCDCLPSCTEVDISIVHDARDNAFDHYRSAAVVEISLANLPTERYKRNVVRDRLDLVVSMGGTTGLFVGASLLSFAEIIYYFIIRPYGTIYMNKKNNNLNAYLKSTAKVSILNDRD